MSAPLPTGRGALARLRLTGVAFLLVLASLVYLTVLFYDKAFTPVVKVELKADRIGNQLSAPADVKIRGLVVGEVRSVRSTGGGATIELALQPDKVGAIPSNVMAQLLPKTLFGEKFVQLVLPTSPSRDHLHAGSVIPQDHSSTALETERVINDLMPLLQSLRPAQLSLTLNALSGALRGRGNTIGESFVRTDAYLRQLNPQLPTLRTDMSELATFTQNTSDAVPNLVRLLDNFSATSRNLVVEKASLDSFLRTTDRFSGSADSILRQNESRLTALASTSLPSLNVFARYAPEYPCLLKSLKDYEPIVAKTFGGLQSGLHITLEPIKDNGGYVAGQEPKYRDQRGPDCMGLPHPTVPQGDRAFDDGYRPAGSGQSRGSAAAAAYLAPTDPQQSNRAAVDAVAAPMLGVTAGEVPDLAELLFGPLASGTTVGIA